MDIYGSFVSNYRVKRFARGEIILQQGEIPTATYLIKSGAVKTYNLTKLGEEKPIAFNLSGELFSLGWTYQEIEVCQYFYEAFTVCEVYVIPRTDYVKFVFEHPEAMQYAFRRLVKQNLGHQMLVNALEQSKAADKVIFTLAYLVKTYGVKQKTGRFKIDLPLTQQDLANFMGLTRETTTIELKKLERKSVIVHRKKNYIVDTEKLAVLLGEDFEVTNSTPKSNPRLKLPWLKW